MNPVDGFEYTAPGGAYLRRTLFGSSLEETISLSPGTNMVYNASVSQCAHIHFSGSYYLKSFKLLRDMPHITGGHYMFQDCINIQTIDLKQLTSTNGNMFYMFARCSKLRSVNISNLTANWQTIVDGIFEDCTNLTDITCKSETAKVLINNADAAFLPDVFRDLSYSGWHIV